MALKDWKIIRGSNIYHPLYRENRPRKFPFNEKQWRTEVGVGKYDEKTWEADIFNGSFNDGSRLKKFPTKASAVKFAKTYIRGH